MFSPRSSAHLASVATLETVSVGVIPADAEMHALTQTAFILYEDRIDDRPPFVKVETPHASLSASEPADVQVYRDRLDAYRRSASSAARLSTSCGQSRTRHERTPAMYPPPHQAPYTDGPTARQDARTMPNAAPQQALMPPPQRRSRIPALRSARRGGPGRDCPRCGLARAAPDLQGPGPAEPDHMRQALTSTQSTLAKAQSGNAVKVHASERRGVQHREHARPYSVICSTDLHRASGPAQYYFACSDQKP